MKYESIIKKMTLEQKASLMSGKDFWQTQDIESAGIPSIFLSDGPHGLRKQAAAADHLGLNQSIPATCFPTAATMANTWDSSLGEKLGKALGEEAVSMKVNVVLGPGLNMKRDPRCGRNFEYFSEDPYLAGKMAASYVRGIQENGIASCIKHFACNQQEERRMTLDSIVDERALREVYLTGFEIAVKEGKAKAIMSSYNLLNGDFANENKHLLVDILRDDWKFEGTVITDWGGDNDRVKAIKTMNALEMPSNAGDTDREIVAAIKNGTLTEEELDKCVDNLLQLIFDTEKPFENKEKKEFDKVAHNKIALECAQNSAVLLKNKDNILPLKAGTKVALIGDFAKEPRYQGAGSSIVNPTMLDNTVDQIKNYDLKVVGYAPGFDRYGKKSRAKIEEALEISKDADVLLVYLGLDEITEAEGLDRKNISLPENEIELISKLKELNKPIVVVLSCGSAVELSFVDQIDALLHIYLSGQAGATATLDILTGKVNPSGKLSETIPLKLEDVPAYKLFPAPGKTSEYRESVYIGYRYYDTFGVDVRFPFGFGLSYTNFEYSDLKIDENGVSFKITNTGKVEGKEIAELYIAKKDSVIFRPSKELKGFTKVDLKPGETKEVSIAFDDKSFRYFNVKTNKWEIEGGRYEILIGSSSMDIRLSGTVEKVGTTEEIPYDKEKLPTYFNHTLKDHKLEISAEEFETLYGRKLPPSKLTFYKKNRIVIDYNITVEQLRYSRGWTGRCFSWAIRFAISALKAFGQRSLANTLIMGVLNQPMRGISRMTNGAISYKQLDALIYMFNGHFFKGLSRFFKAGSEKKKIGGKAH